MFFTSLTKKVFAELMTAMNITILRHNSEFHFDDRIDNVIGGLRTSHSGIP